MNSIYDVLIDFNIDEIEIKNRFLFDDKFYKQMLVSFIKNDHNYQNLVESIKNNNYSEAFERAHALKGIVGNLGLVTYFNAVSSLVDALKNNRIIKIDNMVFEVKKNRDLLLSIVDKID